MEARCEHTSAPSVERRVAEQAVRRVWEGTRSLLLQSGLPHPCWAHAAKAFCAPRNAVDKVDGDKTPHFLRHGSHLGSLLALLSSTRRHRSRQRVQTGCFRQERLAENGAGTTWCTMRAHCDRQWHGTTRIYTAFEKWSVRPGRVHIPENASEPSRAPHQRVLPPGQEATPTLSSIMKG